jgi:hypothetical protein
VKEGMRALSGAEWGGQLLLVGGELVLQCQFEVGKLLLPFNKSTSTAPEGV